MMLPALAFLSLTAAAAASAPGPCSPYDAFDHVFPWRPEEPLLVAADGTGNCTSIQGAVDLLLGPKAAYRSRFTIHVAPGTYREKVRVPPIAPPLTLRGLGATPGDVTIVWDDAEYSPDSPEGCRGNAGREWDSQTLQVAADDFTAAELTVWNSACSNEGGRNFAVAVTADRAAFFRVRLLGGQDTLYTGFKRVYLRDSFVNGTGDFLFGVGTAVFEECELQSARSHGYVTAAKGHNVSQIDGAAAMCDLGWGEACEAYAIIGGRLTGAAGASGVYLGRPWHGDWATVVYVSTWMGPHVAAAGWDPWDTKCRASDERCSSVFFAEYNSTGPGAVPGGRVRWSRQLSAEEAARYSVARVLRGWRPSDPGPPPEARPPASAALPADA